MGSSNNSANGKEFKGQTLILEGSRSGESIPRFEASYNSTGNLEYAGESKFGSLTTDNKWYLEKLIYNSTGNLIRSITAINQIYTGSATVDIDTVTNAPFVTITFTGGDLDSLNVKDDVRLVTGSNDIQGIVTSFNRATGVFIVDTGGVAATPEVGVAIGATDCLITMKHPETKPFNRRIWDKRTQYVYE